MRPLGTGLVVAITLLVLGGVLATAALKSASSDLNSQIAIARNDADVPSRSPIGQLLTIALARDIAGDDVSGLVTRSALLDHRGDRLLEATAVAALVGMLVWLMVMRPVNQLSRMRDETTPLARTSNNGTV